MQKRPFWILFDKDFVGLADSLLPFNEFDFVLDDLNCRIQFITLSLQQLSLVNEGFQILPQAVVADERFDLRERIPEPAQIADGGKRIYLVEMIKPAVVFGIADFRNQQPFCVIVPKELHIHVKNSRQFTDRQIFFHKNASFQQEIAVGFVGFLKKNIFAKWALIL